MHDKMLRAVIVDDEHLVRDLLKNCIDWNELGYEMAGEASCAQEALELIDEIVPDIVITDIHMPYMDGIEFSRIVIEKYPMMKIIILTGYEEFEYAKKSIKIGIADFLLKPINDEEIKKVVLRMKERIESEKSHRMEYSRLKRNLEENLPYLREKLLNELILNRFEDEDIMKRLDYFRIKLDMDAFQVAVIDLAYPDTGTGIEEEERVLLLMHGREIVMQYFRDDEFVNVFFDNSRRIVILNSGREIEFSDCLETVRIMLINRLKCYACIGVGNVCNSLRKLALSYREACNALDYKVVAGKNQVISYSDINFMPESSIGMQNDQTEFFSFYLKAGMKNKVLELLDDCFNENIPEQRASVDAMRAAASNIVSVVLNVTAETGIGMQEVFGCGTQPFDEIFRLDTFPEMKEYLVKLVTSLTCIVEGMQTKRVSQVVKQAQNHIMKNLQNSDLNLSNTAKAFFVNVSYLSRIFKQETGQTFIEYVTRARMEKAMKLLKQTDLKAYQIAEEVGIADPHYFGICFKKFTGMSVNDFKKNL